MAPAVLSRLSLRRIIQSKMAVIGITSMVQITKNHAILHFSTFLRITQKTAAWMNSRAAIVHQKTLLGQRRLDCLITHPKRAAVNTDIPNHLTKKSSETLRTTVQYAPAATRKAISK